MSKGQKILRFLKEYPLAVISTFVVVACLVAIFLRGSIAVELSNQEAELNKRMRTIEQNAKNAKDLQSDLEAMEQFVELIESRLFDREQRAVNLDFFYAMEERMDIRIASISQSPGGYALYGTGGARALKLHSTISYSLSINGQFEDILLFLDELDRVEPLIRVVSLELSGANQRVTGNQMLNASLQLIVLARK